MPASATERVCLELVRVPLDAAGGTLAAAIYLAVLAFPESKPKRTAFLEDVKSFNVHEAVASGWAKKRGVTFPPQYMKRKLAHLEVSGPLVTATQRIWRDRLPASVIADGLMLRGAFKDSPLKVELSIGGTAVIDLKSGALGLARRSKELRKPGHQLGRGDEAKFAKNYRDRGWRASLPVLHLAIALGNVLDGLRGEQDDAPHPSVMDLTRSPAWVPGAIRRAEKLRILLARRADELHVAPSDTICLLVE